MKIAILGAPGTGKTWLANTLNHAISGAAEITLEAPHNISIHDAPALGTVADADLIFLMGLDWQPGSGGHFNAETREKEDSTVRANLQHRGLDFKVIYGSPANRLATALRSINIKYATNFVAAPACPEPVLATFSSKIAQKWIWNCDKCSDPDCEHRLFTALRTT